jgi:hypothetical protein
LRHIGDEKIKASKEIEIKANRRREIRKGE